MDKIPEGYKKTEIGLIPEDWMVRSVGEIFKVTRGQVLSVKLVSQVTNSLNRYPVYSSQTVNDGLVGYYDSYLYENAITWTTDGANAGIVNYRRGKFYCTNVCGVLLNSQGFANLFMAHKIGSVSKSYVSYVGNPKLMNNVVDKILVAIPPLEEQIAYSQKMSDIESLIVSTEKLIEKKKMIRQGVMQELLTGKRRLAGFRGEWKKSPLKILLETPVTDGPHLTPKFVTNGIPFLSVNNIKENTIDVSDLRFITKEDDLEFSRKCKPRKGDILLGKAATVGTVALVENDWDFNIWSPLALIRMKNNLEPRFFYYQLQSNNIYSQIKFLTNSSSQGNLGMSDIEKLEVYSPTREEQVAVSNTLSLIDSDLVLQKAKLSKLKQIKQGAMQQLLTGKIRLINK